VVGGVAHNMNAHQMAAGSEVDILARTTQPGHGRGESSGRGEGGSSATAAAVVCGESGQAGLSVLASLHRKLIVQQVKGGRVCVVQYLGHNVRAMVELGGVGEAGGWAEAKDSQ